MKTKSILMGPLLLAAIGSITPTFSVSRKRFYTADENGAGVIDAPPRGSAKQILGSLVVEYPVDSTESIEIKKLKLDAGTQPRTSLDEEKIEEYAEVIRQAVKDEQPIPFPPIDVFRDDEGTVIPADGFHRIGSHKRAHIKEIECNIHFGGIREAMLFAFRANATHGVPRTNKDKRRAVKALLTDEEWTSYTNTAIAEAAVVSEKFVRDMRVELKAAAPAVRIGKGGRKIDTSAIGKGKGGGKKGERDKKAAGKTQAAAKEDSKKGDSAHSLSREILKIATSVGGDEGGKVRRAIEDGALALKPSQIKAWSGMKPADAKRIAPLVTGSHRLDPWKAYEFVTSELSEKIVQELHRRAIGSPGGVFEYSKDGVKITVTHTGK